MSAAPPATSRLENDVPYGLTVAAAWSWRVVAVIVGVGVLCKLLGYVSLIVIPILVAALLATLLAPVYEGLRKARLPKVPAALACVLLLVVVVVGLMAVAGQQIVKGFTDLQDKLIAAADSAMAWLRGMGVDLPPSQGGAGGLVETVRQHSATVLDGAVSFGSTAANVGTGAFIALFTLLFFLYDGDRIWRFLLFFVPKDHRATVGRAGRSGWRALGSYVRVQIFVAAVDAVGIGLGALLLGVPLAVPLGILVFLGSFIPMVGAVVTGGLAVLLALAANGPVNALLMIGVVILVQQIESYALQPLVMGKAVSLHPLAVFLAVGAGSAVLGLVGAVFAVPTLAFVNSFVRALATEQPDALTSRSTAALDPDREAGDVVGSHVYDKADFADPALATEDEAGTRKDLA